ncbi:MAG: hypothetical protein AB7O88_26700 [Reyranellaceae bacterium]
MLLASAAGSWTALNDPALGRDEELLRLAAFDDVDLARAGVRDDVGDSGALPGGVGEDLVDRRDAAASLAQLRHHALHRRRLAVGETDRPELGGGHFQMASHFLPSDGLCTLHEVPSGSHALTRHKPPMQLNLSVRTSGEKRESITTRLFCGSRAPSSVRTN